MSVSQASSRFELLEMICHRPVLNFLHVRAIKSYLYSGPYIKKLKYCCSYRAGSTSDINVSDVGGIRSVRTFRSCGAQNDVSD